MLRMAAIMVAGCVSLGTANGQSRTASGARGGVSAPHTIAPGIRNRTTIRISGGRPFGRRGLNRGFGGEGFIGGYGWPYFYDDYAESYEPQAEPIAEAAPPPPPVQVKAEPVPDPVLLELRGNQWTKVENFTTAPAAAPVSSASTLPAPAPAPAILVYRDGHSEEVSSYSIIGPVIYTKGDYWSSGNWTRKIQIADLDLPATLKQNQDRGVKFELPSGPNEVMIRP